MKKFLILFLLAFLISCSEKSKSTNIVKSERYICNESNSLFFYDYQEIKNVPNKINFNSDVLKFCEINGNVLTYKSDGCEQAKKTAKNLDDVIEKIGRTIRFDFVLEEIILNNPPRQIVMKCTPAN